MKPSPVLLVVVLCLAVAPAPAARLASGTFTLPAGETSLGDLYFGGSILRLDGRLDGSVVAGARSAAITGAVSRNVYVAAQNLDVSGTVAGDIAAACATLSVTGPVSGAIRALCGIAAVNNRVGQDVLAGCQALTIGPDAEVRGDVIAGCNSLEISGVVRGDVRASAAVIVISGIVDGDVEVNVGQRLLLADSARIFGNLRYRSDLKLDIGNPDAVFGTTEFVPNVRPERSRPLRPHRWFMPALFFPFSLLSLLAALATGFIVVAIFRRTLLPALDESTAAFGRTVGLGAVGFFATPLAALLSLAAVVTIPAAAIVLVLYLVCIYLAKILAGIFAGRLIFRLFGVRNASLWAAVPVGIAVVYAFCAIPVVGWLVWLFAVLVGFGVIVLLLARFRRA
uniref:Polymer-forming cytoskeletal protein n=1 Tax=candidate division WOR-3 bacterium TaxID=2052148 RepID=A0A7C4GDV1_UNCW3